MENEFSAAILGGGQLGSAVSALLKRKNVQPASWDVDPLRIPGQKSLEETIRPAEYVLLCVPSWATRKAVADILPFLSSRATVISCAKGIDLEKQKFMSELLGEMLPAGQPFAVLGGSMLVQEIMGGKKAIGVFASRDAQALQNLHDIFSSPDFSAELVSDPLSVCVAGVLKNIYAVGIGVSDGLDLGDNVKGWLASVAIREMMGIAGMLGVDPKIIAGAAGVGDFIATGWSSGSQNHRIGMELARTGMCSVRGEGLTSLPPLLKRLGPSAATFSFLALIASVGIHCAPARTAFEIFFQAKRD